MERKVVRREERARIIAQGGMEETIHGQNPMYYVPRAPPGTAQGSTAPRARVSCVCMCEA